jgi:hypothetical protein
LLMDLLTGHQRGAVIVRVAVDSSREGGCHTVRVLADDVCIDPERDGWVSVSEPLGDHVDRDSPLAPSGVLIALRVG